MTTVAGSISYKPTALLVTDNCQLTSEAQSALGDRIIPANSIKAANDLLETRMINLVILDLHLNQNDTKQIVEDIRKHRPEIKFLISQANIGSDSSGSYLKTIKNQFYSIIKNTNGAVTVEQIERAIFWVEFLNRIRFRVVIIMLCLVMITVLATLSNSPVGKLLGAFWVTLLAIEFLCYVACSMVRLKGEK